MKNKEYKLLFKGPSFSAEISVSDNQVEFDLSEKITFSEWREVRDFIERSLIRFEKPKLQITPPESINQIVAVTDTFQKLGSS